MPAKKSKAQAKPTTQATTEPIIRDVPRGGYTCRTYHDGHNVHYIPVTRVVPDLEPVSARIECQDEKLTLLIDQSSTPVHSHNPAAIGLLIEELGSACLWYPTLRLACWPLDGERHWASLALEPVGPCSSAEDVHIAELRHWS